MNVDDDTLLVAVERAEEADAEPGKAARLVAARRLDLDHFGAEVGEDHPARRPHHHVRELGDANAFERELLLLHGDTYFQARSSRVSSTATFQSASITASGFS